MKGNFEQCLALTLKEEGGYVNHPADPGGMTNLGVTKRTYEGWLKREATEAEMRALKPKDVEPIYRFNYWNAVRADELPMGVDSVVFDLAVNSGPTTAVKFLQRALELPADGKFGPKTLQAVNDADPEKLVERICQLRLDFLKSLSTWPTFGKGWARRVKTVQEHGFKMLAMGAEPAVKDVSSNVT